MTCVIGVNRIDAEGIIEHFKHCGTKLTSVDIVEHSAKLRKYSTTIEAWQENKLAGLCACYMNDHSTGIAYITHIEVHPEYKHQGIGRQIMNATIETAKSKNFTKIQLEVNKDNTVALAFYNSFGFRRIEERPTKFLMSLDI